MGKIKFRKQNISVVLKEQIPGFSRTAQFSSLYISYIAKCLYNDSKIKRRKEKVIQLFFRTPEKYEK